VHTSLEFNGHLVKAKTQTAVLWPLQVLPWIALIFETKAAAAALAETCALQQWRARLRFFFMQSLAEMRIGETIKRNAWVKG